MPNSGNQTRSLCVVLPNKMELNINVNLKCKGQEIINQLSQVLGTADLYLFGLSLKEENNHLFLDLKKKLITYFPESQKPTILPNRVCLHLRVQYYIRNGRQIVDEKVRNLYCADLKNRVLGSCCYEQEGLYFQLAAYALQTDLGDWREEVETYFTPQDYFPPWILARRGCDYVVQHTPELHKELRGMSAHNASLLYIEEACSLSDVPLTFYSMFKCKKEKRASMQLGLALTGLHIYKLEDASLSLRCPQINSGEYQLLYELPWSSIDCLKFQGRRFKISADALAGKLLVMYTQSVLHSQHMLKHMSNNHRVQLTTRHSFKQLQREEKSQHKEVYIRDSTDPDLEDSEDELPPLKSYLEKARQHHADTMATVSITSERNTVREITGNVETADLDEIELCVDEPEEMSVDDAEDIIGLNEFLEGVSVDGPPLVTVSQWIDCTMEMKQVLSLRACSLSLDQCRRSVGNTYISHSLNSPEEHVSTRLTYKHKDEDIIF